MEGGGRRDDLGLTSYRGVVGIKGSFLDDNWNYDVSGQYGSVLFAETYQNDFSIARTQTGARRGRDRERPGLPLVRGRHGPELRAVEHLEPRRRHA